MADISTVYAGSLRLKSPFIVASSGLTNRIDRIREYAEAGAGAIVLKSIFEEQLEKEVATLANVDDHPAAAEYLDYYVKSHALNEHLQLLKQCRNEVQVPVIASINCYKSDTWMDYAHELVDAGADALELNVMRIDTDRGQEWGEQEKELIQLVHHMKDRLPEVPLTVKLSKYFSNIVRLARDLHIAGADGVVLFNRTYMPDIDIEREKIVSGPILSSEVEFYDSLRFTSLVHGGVRDLSITLSTGAQGGEDMVKGLLAGADAVQFCSALYRGGAKLIGESNDFLMQWLDEKKYHSVEEIKGRLAATRVDHANMYMRSQFMKHFASEDATPTDIHDPITKPNL